MKRILLCSAMLLLFVAASWAQVANNTSLVGDVLDPSGLPVAGAKVTAVNQGTKVSYSDTSNSDGYYSIPFIAVGTYDITVEQTGFKKITTVGVPVTLNQAVRTNFTLEIGSQDTSVTVTASTPPLSTDDATLGETLSEKLVSNLPMNGRHAMELAATASNIIVGTKSSFTGNPPGEDFVGAGQREITNSLTLDGISIMNNLITTSPVTPNPDAISEVQTQNGNYTAQYGGYMGVHINMVTKSGTNSLHGTAYDYVQNDAFSARNFLDAHTAKTKPLRYNQFGFVLGGPVYLPKIYNGHDKTFFMASYEGLRQNQLSQTTGSVLTQAMRNGDFSAVTVAVKNPSTGVAFTNNQIPSSLLSPIAQKIENYMTLPNVAGTSNGTQNNFNGGVPNNITINQSLDRVDHTIGDNIRLFVRYDWQNLNYVSGAINPTSNAYSPTQTRNIAFGYTQIITPNLINDFRFGRNVLSTNVLNGFAESGPKDAGTQLGIPGFTADTTNNNPGIPDITISNFQAAGATGTNWYQDDRTLHGYDQISYTHGKHNIMAGAELRKLTLGRAAQNGPRGAFTFNGTMSGYSAADFVMGVAQSVTTPVTQLKGSVGEWRDGFFVLDNWQVTQKLTLNYGLRYELPTVPYSLNGYARILNAAHTALIPSSNATSGANFTATPGFEFTGPQHNLWAPRLGVAYRLTDKTTLRGGGGVYYNPNQLNSFTLATGNYPLAASVTYSTTAGNPNLTFANPTAGSGTASPVAGVAGTYVSAFTVNPDLKTPRMYQWNLDAGTQLWTNAGLELQYLGSHSLHLDRSYYINQPTPGPGTVNSRRPNQLFGQIRQIQNDEWANYHGLTAVLRQRSFHGLEGMASYTWSHTLDVSNDSNGGGTPMIFYDPAADYGNSSWDIRHRLVGSISYVIPTLINSNALAKQVVGGWNVNSIVTIQSGMPYNVSIAQDLANVGVGTQRPNWVHTPSSNCTRGQIIRGSKSPCIDATAYTLPSAYTFGNTTRNTLHGPGFFNTDLSIFKNFPIWERLEFQFRAEAFNVFNHPSLGNPNSTLPAAFNPSDAKTYGNFGTVTTVQGHSRVLQLAGKINF